MNAYYAMARKLGVKIVYGANADDLEIRAGRFTSAVYIKDKLSHRVRARAVVLAAGGFQANLDWLKEYWGESADNFIVRGTPYDQGRMLRVLLDRGARPVGNPASVMLLP